MAHSSFTLIGSAAAVAAFTALAVTPLGHQATAQTADVPTGASAPTIQLAQASGNGGSGGGSS